MPTELTAGLKLFYEDAQRIAAEVRTKEAAIAKPTPPAPVEPRQTLCRPKKRVRVGKRIKSLA